MTLTEHARRELELIHEDPALTENVMAVVGAFAAFGHSGSSAEFAADYVSRLLRFEPLSPITSDAAEWEDRSEMSGTPLWQNIRDGKAFSDDGGKSWWRIDAQGNRIAEPVEA